MSAVVYIDSQLSECSGIHRFKKLPLKTVLLAKYNLHLKVHIVYARCTGKGTCSVMAFRRGGVSGVLSTEDC